MEFTSTIPLSNEQISATKEVALLSTRPPSSTSSGNMWHLHVDGSSNQKGAVAGLVLVTPDGTVLEQSPMLGLKASKNEAKYEALLVGLWLAKELSVKSLAIHSDSQLITNQISDEYKLSTRRWHVTMTRCESC